MSEAVVVTNDDAYVSSPLSLFLLTEPQSLIPGLDPPPSSSMNDYSLASQPSTQMMLSTAGGPVPGEPVYAQVNRDRKLKHQMLLQQQMTPTASRSDSSSTQALLGSDQRDNNHFLHGYHESNNEVIYPPAMPAGDSWV